MRVNHHHHRHWPRTVLIVVILAAASLAGVGVRGPWQPVRPQAADVVVGVQRLAWSQEAPSPVVVTTYRFAAVVDGVRKALVDARCVPARFGTDYDCDASLPAMIPGGHQIAVVALNAQGLSSAPSESLTVTVGGATPVTPLNPGGRICAPGGTCFDVEVIASRLAEPRHVEALPDGRLLFVEGNADVRIVDGNRISLAHRADSLSGARVRVAGIAAAADFSTTRHVFLAVVRTQADGTARTDIVRAREVGGRLGEMVTVVPELPTAPETEPALAVAPDGRLYVGMAARSPESRTSAYDGSVLRFEADGRSAAAPGWPVLASGYFSPMTIDVDPDGRVWLGSLTAANPSAPVSVLVPGATGEQRSQMRPLSPAMRNWPEGATGIRTLVAVAGAGAVAPSLYLVPRGVAGLLVAAASRSLRELTIAQLPLPQIEPTALAALPSGVLVVGGLEPGRPPASAGTLLRLRPAP